MEENERLRILRMIAEGKISPEEGEALLQALHTPAAADKDEEAKGKARWLRIQVAEDGEQYMSVRLPLRLVELGLRIAKRFSPEENLDQIALALNEAIQSGVTGKIIDVEDMDANRHVEILFE